jgi:hypothetical protein
MLLDVRNLLEDSFAVIFSDINKTIKRNHDVFSVSEHTSLSAALSHILSARDVTATAFRVRHETPAALDIEKKTRFICKMVYTEWF